MIAKYKLRYSIEARRDKWQLKTRLDSTMGECQARNILTKTSQTWQVDLAREKLFHGCREDRQNKE